MSDEYKARIMERINRFHDRAQKNIQHHEKQASKQLGPRKAKTDVPTERQEQVRVAKLLAALGLLWCAVPNSGHGTHGKAGAVRGARLRAEGLKAGCPDILVFDRCPKPPGGESQGVGLAIELKRTKGGKVSEAQKVWLEELEKRGWVCRVCRGFDEAHATLKELGYV